MGLRRRPNQSQVWPKTLKRQTRSDRFSAVSKIRVVRLARVAFEELAQAFIEHNIPSQVTERLLRAAYIHETAKKVGTGWGGRPNVSQISVKTGLDRHLVKSILSNESEALRIPKRRRDPLTRITDGWTADPEYCTSRGPRDLVRGDRRGRNRSLYSLVARYAPGVSPSLVVRELLEAGYVTLLPNGRLRLLDGKSHPQGAQVAQEPPSSRKLRETLSRVFSPNRRR